MKNSLEVVDDLYTLLDGSSLKTEISGNICKHQRDGNSDKEDVVINCLPINNQQLQNGIANVNIYAKDIIVNINGMNDSQPNHARLLVLAKQAEGIINDYWSEDGNYDTQQQVLIQDKDSGSHYINIRVNFFIENI